MAKNKITGGNKRNAGRELDQLLQRLCTQAPIAERAEVVKQLTAMVTTENCQMIQQNVRRLVSCRDNDMCAAVQAALARCEAVRKAHKTSVSPTATLRASEARVIGTAAIGNGL